MSGLLRRMKRSRATGPGEVPAPGQDASAEPATTPITGPEPASDSSFRRPDDADESFRRPDADADRSEDFTWESGTGARPEPAPFLQPESGDRRPAPFLQSDPEPFASPGPDDRAGDRVADAEDAGDTPPAERTAPLPLDEPDPARPPGGPALGAPAATPVSAPVAEGPAGLDPAEAAARPPAGRRGRLRRRLRYLRRARELMLRDLGGLVYEIHRTGGGDLPAHAGLMAGKIERLATLDAEAHSLEAVLAAPREQVALFEPGVGGACDACGELYGSDARFCSRCGTPTSGELQPLERAAPSPASERAPTLAEPAPDPQPPMPEEPAQPAAPGAEAATSMLPATGIDQPTQAFGGPAEGSEQDERTEATGERDDDRTGAPGDGTNEREDDPARTLRDAEDPADEPTADEGRTRALRPAGGRRTTGGDDPAPDRDAPPADGDEGERTPPPGEVLRWRERRG